MAKFVPPTPLRWVLPVALALVQCVSAFGAGKGTVRETTTAKPRVIATTDGEIDDRCSMIRFLLYANEWDIQGIVHSSSKYHWLGDDTAPGKHWEPVAWLDRQLDAYEAVYPSLKSNDAGYPTPEYLRAHVFVGNIALEGDMRSASPGSDRIVEVLLQSDPSPVWLQAWGGANTIARALKTIKEEHPDRVAEVTKKARIFLISEQDNTLKTYISPEWPGVQVLLSRAPSFHALGYIWRKVQSPDVQVYFDRDWMVPNILEGHGPLCAMYEASKGSFRSEGDTPAFLHTINTGLRSDEHPDYGGWGGRFALSNGVWKSVDTDTSTPHSILRWAKDFQNDWAARADWCVKNYADSNHPPQVVLKGVQQVSGKRGYAVSLNVGGTKDPDGDALRFQWWIYTEAGTCQRTPVIKNADKAKAKLVVPADAAAGDTVHAVCSVTDNGVPPLTRYARVVVSVAE